MWINKKYINLILLACFIITSCKKSIEKETPSVHIDTKKTKVDELPYFNTPDFAPTWLSNNKELSQFHKIPEFNFTNQLGVQIASKNLEGKIYLASFFFTSCPNICLKLTENMRELQNIYVHDDSVKLLSHTVMPSVDTVEVLKDYGERQSINPKKWYLLTGEKEKIYELAREAYFADDLYKQTNDKNRFVHTENIILVDKKGHIRGVYKGTLPEEIKRIQRHINMLKKE